MEELTDREKVVLGRYLSMDPAGWRWWIVGMLLGAVICLLGILLFFAVPNTEGRLVFLGCFIVGLVVMEVSLDYRRNQTVAGIVQKYHRALTGGGGE